MAANPLEDYLRELRDIRRSGSAVPETSYYTPLVALFEAVGSTLKPKVRCILNPSHGAGIPDVGLFTPDQFQKASAEEPLPGTKPSRGVVEAKPTGDDAFLTADTAQVSKYWKAYRQVLVTNFRDFLLLGADAEGNPAKLEHYRLAPNEAAFWTAASHPRPLAAEQAEAFVEFLKRVMLHAASLAAPKDVAWFLASYAREALRRVEKRSDVPALLAIRSALEEALNIKFEDNKGEHFFRSTLIQTLFYGVFSAWVLWARDHSPTDRKARFDWRTAGYYLRVPVLAELFHQASNPASLAGLELPEVLDWTGTVLNRIDRAAFFTAFEQHHAVQYFYEPFLEAYDPQLRKQLGVWYTPREVVRYMVARVDRVLRDELAILDGLAASNVYVLDPCCGTGSYLIEVLNRIGETLREKGGDALTAQEIKRAAMERVFGFEILPAPFVVTHLQIGLLLQSLGAPLSETGKERAGVYLTNGLTGWEPPDGSKPQMLLAFPELLQERDAAERVKQAKPILVILGNPPYNAFAGVSPSEEHGIVDVYKDGLISKWNIKKFNLDDLYVRFFRIAERRIAEQTGRGIVCFISNFSYLDNPSFVLLRQRYIRGFDKLWFDCMNGDSRETGKLTPDGKPDPSIFSTDHNKEGIRVGTAIALMVRKAEHQNGGETYFREFWGVSKKAELVDGVAASDLYANYEVTNPTESNRYSFRPSNVSEAYTRWPRVTELAAIPGSNGLMEKRGGALIDIERGKLEERMRAYFDADLSWAEYQALDLGLTQKQAGFDPKASRQKALNEEVFDPERLIRYTVRPFDTQWCYYTSISAVWNRPRPQLWRQLGEDNSFVLSRFSAVKTPEGVPFYFTYNLCDDHLLSPDATAFSTRVKGTITKPNLSRTSCAYLSSVGFAIPEKDIAASSALWMHVLAIGFSHAYLTENANGIRKDWPRIPLTASKETLLRSAEIGRDLSALLDVETSVTGVTIGNIRSELRELGSITREGGGSLNPDSSDLDLTAGWGHGGNGSAVMPGKGKIVERDYTAKERDALATGAAALGLPEMHVIALLGDRTFDVYLNNLACWRNIPVRVWAYTIGGYQVIKKWLSYRERPILGRGLTLEEVRTVTEIARRIAAIILMEPALNANYEAVKKSTYAWPAAPTTAEIALPTGEQT